MRQTFKSALAAVAITAAFANTASATPNQRPADVAAKVIATHNAAAKAIHDACQTFYADLPVFNETTDKAVLEAIGKAFDAAIAGADVDVEAACNANHDKAMEELIELDRQTSGPRE
jgi:hypothetical protein